MGGCSTFLQPYQNKWNTCAPPQSQQYGTNKCLRVLSIFRKQPFSVPTKTTLCSNTKPSPVQSLTVIPAITNAYVILGIFLELTVYLIQLLNAKPTRISCFSPSIFLPSLPTLCLAPSECRPPNTHHIPPGVVIGSFDGFNVHKIILTPIITKLHTSMTKIVVVNPVQAAWIQLLCKLYAVSRLNMFV